MTTQPKTFNPNEKMIQIKNGKGEKQDYLPVQWRLVWFREVCPNGTIDTDEIEVDLDREVEAEGWVYNPQKQKSEKIVKRGKGYARFKAIITDGKGGRSTGHKTENAANFSDYVEKAETGCIGRALAGLGYGTQFTGDEFVEGERLADAPVTRKGSQNTSNQEPEYTSSNASQTNARPNNNASPSQENPTDPEARITDQQLSSIRKLCEHMSKAEPENVTQISYLEAKKVIQGLTAEYREFKQKEREATTA